MAAALVLGGSALVLGGAFAAMAALGDLVVHAQAFLALFIVAGLAYGLAAAWIVRRPALSRWGLSGVLMAGVVFRVVLLPGEPTLSTDLYRYLWDGRLATSGVSPYRYPANALELQALRDARVYPRLNHADWRTIYPPGAQLLFAGVARLGGGSVRAFKLVFVGFDLLTIALLAGWLRDLGRPTSWTLLYAWHPLAIVELAGSGHLDAVAVATMVAALRAATRGREALAGVMLGAGGLVKLYPLLLLPAVWGRRPARPTAAALGVVAAGYAWYVREGPAVLGSLGRYVHDETFNSGLRLALEWMLGGLGSSARLVARVLPLVGLAALAGWIALRGRALPTVRRARWLIGGYLLAVPSLFPWYAVWMVPVLAVDPVWPWLYLTCAVGLTYAVFFQPAWAIPTWAVIGQFGPLALGLGLSAWTRGGAARRGCP